jgi:iron complex outermembrane receptor protein
LNDRGILSTWGGLFGAGVLHAATVLDPVSVTGTRLAEADRGDVEQVVVLTAEELQRNDTAGWGERLRRLPQSGAGSLSAGRFGSLAPGAEAIALRGLGPEATLVLLNGRRLAVYPFAEDGSVNFVDLRSLPLTAIGAVEILPSNASAIYGSDAVAGVVNFKLDDRFAGGLLTVSHGNTAAGEAGRTRAAARWGRQAGRAGWAVGFEHARQRALPQRARAFAASDDKVGLGGSDFRSSVANPGTVFDPATGRRLAVPANSRGRPSLAELRPGNARFDRSPFQTLLPETEQTGLSLLAHFELNRRWELFGEALAQRIKTRLELAPPPIQGDDQDIRVPAQNPFNPFGAAAYFRYRVTEAGARIQEIATDSIRLLAGLRGRWGDRWEAEAALLFHQNDSTQVEFNHLDRPAVVAALAQTDPARALNVFGAGDAINPPTLIESLKAAPERRGYSRLRGVDGLARGPVAAWAAGDVRVALGGEWRWEDLSDRPDPRAERGDIVDFKGTAARGARETVALFGETRAPLLAAPGRSRAPRLEVQAAGRYERNDDFGGIFTPQVNLRWTLVEGLVVRSGYGRSFRAPGLAQLHSAQTRQTRDLRDTTRFRATGADADRLSALLVRSGGNPALEAESADSLLLGAEWTAHRDLVLSATAFRIAQSDAISGLDPQFILDNEARFPGLVQRQAASAGDQALGIPGPVIAVDSSFQNLAQARIEGIDLGLAHHWRPAAGELAVRADAAWLGRYLETSRPGQPAVDRAGGFGHPRWRAKAAVTWQRRAWTVGYEWELVGRFADTEAVNRIVGRSSTHHAFVSWTMAAHPLTLQVRVENLADTPPPFANNVQGYAPALSDPRGRVFSLSARWRL